MSNLLSLSQKPWKEVASVAEGASVFIDDAAAEIFHWSEGEGALDGLAKQCLGIYSLYIDLNPIAKDMIAQAPYCNVVIVTTKPLIGRCAERIATVLSDIQPLECHVYCTVSEAMHEVYTPLKDEGGGASSHGYSHYGEFQALMKKWIKRESGVRVSVSHLDLFHVEILPNLFLTPVYHDTLFSFIPSDMPQLQSNIDQINPDVSLECLDDLQYNLLPIPHQNMIKSFVQSFNSFLLSMDLHDELFSVGPMSSIIADQLSYCEDARTRRKTASKKCSVLFLDRSLDLASPCSRSNDYLMDRILSQLPSLGTNGNDVSISVAPLSDVDPRCLAPGCIAHPGNSKTANTISSLAFSKQKEALMELSRNLLEILSKEKIASRQLAAGRMGKSSHTQVMSFLEQFKNNPKTIMKHNELLQMGCGVVEVLERSLSKDWEQLCKDEQKLIQNLLIGENAPSVLISISNLVNSQLHNGVTEQRHMLLVDILSLIVEFYSLIGEECFTHNSEEINLKESLTNLLLMKRECDREFLINIGLNADISKLEVMQLIDTMFDCFNSLGVVRERMSHLKDIYTPDANSCISPLLIQLLTSICDPAHSDLPDVRHHAHGLSSIIRSSFSLFMSSARPRPDNHPLLIIYIVGGVSVSEVRAIKEYIAVNKPNFEIYIGANKLLTPHKLVEDLLRKKIVL